MSVLTNKYYERMWQIAKEQFILGKDSIHGFNHWESVYRNTTILGAGFGYDLDVLKHFAIFHDCKRQDDFADPKHGSRARQLLQTIQPQIKLNNNQFILLCYAVEHHSEPLTSDSIEQEELIRYNPLPFDLDYRTVIGSCWDSDRLELLRCNVCPDPNLMNTPIGKLMAEKLSELHDRVGSGLM